MVNNLTIIRSLEPFLCQPREKLHLAEISRRIKESHPTVRLWLNDLEKKGILKKEHRGRQTLYFLNLESPNIIDFLVISEKLRLINNSEKWLLLGELSSFIHKNYGESLKIFIFGSATDDFKQANDVDMIIVGKAGLKLLKDFGKRINKKIHLIHVDNLEKISATLKEEIIKKHLLIKNRRT